MEYFTSDSFKKYSIDRVQHTKHKDSSIGESLFQELLIKFGKRTNEATGNNKNKRNAIFGRSDSAELIYLCYNLPHAILVQAANTKKANTFS